MRTSGLLTAVTTVAVLATGLGPAASADPGPTTTSTTSTTTETVVIDHFDEGTSRTTTYAVPSSGERLAAARSAPSGHRAYVAIATGPAAWSVSAPALVERVRSATAYWVEQSDATVSSFPVVGSAAFTTTRATLANGCGLGNSTVAHQVWAEAASVFPGVDFGSASGNHLVVLVPAECTASGATGIASMGSGTASGGKVLADGESASAPTTLVHELGHNLGLGHAGSQTCPTPITCTTSEYGDVYDPMGYTNEYAAPALGSAHRADLGVLGAAESPRVELPAGRSSASGQFVLAPRGLLSGQRSVTALDPVTGTEYQVDLRAGAGRDLGSMWLVGPLLGSVLGFASGVTVTARGDGATSLLQTRPIAGRPARSAWLAGETFVSRSGGVSVAVRSVGLGSAVVDVTVGAQPYIPPLTDPPLDGNPAVFGAERPVIVGRARVGRTVRVRTADYPDGTTLAVQWLAGGRKVPGATGPTLRLRQRYAGARLTVRVIASRPGYLTERIASKPVRVRT